MNKYNLILLSCAADSELKAWAQKPFVIDDVAYATDYSIMAIIPASLTENVGPLKDRETKTVLNVLPEERQFKLKISTAILDHAISLCPMVPDEVDCTACDGEGSVDYNFEFDGEDYFKELECPVCNGDGSVKDKSNKILDPKKLVRIGDSVFAVGYLKKILDAAMLLECVSIDLVLQNTSSGKNIFKFDQVEILLMQCLNDPDYEVIYEIAGD